MEDLFHQNLTTVLERMSRATERSGRLLSSVELVAISKTQPVEKIREAVEQGLHLFGESRLQEAMAKISLLPARLQWHFIGPLQANKIRKALPLFDLFHGVDSLAIARDMDRIAAELGLFPKVLLEVNVSKESSKHGFLPTALKECFEELLTLPRLQIEGFMTMAPLAKDPETTRPFFAALRELRDVLTHEAGIPLPTLSMGMSGDYEIAIEEGATLIRIGSALFGKR